MAAVIALLAVSMPAKGQDNKNLNDESKLNIAQVIIDKGLNRINVELRKSVITDVYSIDEEYENKQTLIDGRPKSKTESRKVLIGRPKLDRLNIDDLYKAFATRFDFFFDNDRSIETIDGITYALVQYRPRANLTSDTVTDFFINRTVGKVYINMDNYDIYKIEGGINHHFLTVWKNKWLPFVSFDIDVYEFSFSIEYTEFSGMVIEKNLTGMVDYEIRKRGVEKHSYSLSNFRFRNR